MPHDLGCVAATNRREMPPEMKRLAKTERRVDVANASDAALVDAITSGDESALAEVYRRHSSSIYGLALRILRRADMAQEVLQEVVCGLWERPDRFDAERGGLRPWLLRMAHGKAVDRLRSETRRQAREEKSLVGEDEQRGDLEREVWELVRAEVVRNALTTLNPGEQEAITLAYFGGHTYRDVAKLLDIPEGTVKSRIRLGLGKLADHLAAAGLGPSAERSQP
jgi:RNA polymerase sigma-70 factor, ECF subfamily